jgi:hypothetical protein
MNSVQSGTRDQWQQINSALSQKAGAPLDHRLDDPSAGLRINISKERTDQQLEMFTDAAKPFVNKE